jgi:oxygen-dependent protoporphyrinogen oxidase
VGYTEKVCVIGAGISGLTCAFRLKQLGVRCIVLESTERAGGLIASIRRNGYLFETGPQFPRFPAPLWRLVQDLQLQDELVIGDANAKRYIFRHGKLHPAPFSPIELIKTNLVGLKSKLRILRDPFQHTQPPNEEESLANFIERKFDADILDNLIDPFISTIFLGDAASMGMESAFPALVEWERSRGSLLRGALAARKSKQNGKENGTRLHVTEALPTLGSFKSGMATLPEKLDQELGDAIRYRTQVESIASPSSVAGAHETVWKVRLRGGECIHASHLVFAVPAYVTAKLLVATSPELANHLNAIPYAPICTFSCAYERSDVAHPLDGLGFMVPRREGLHTICTFWNSSLFAGRAPQGTVLITSFAGRAGDDAFAAMTDDERIQAVEAENARILEITGHSLEREFWKEVRALPQYNVGHAARVRAIANLLPSLPNLHIAGNFLTGRSLGDCVDVANRVAENVHSQLQRQIPVMRAAAR